jgi:hypothetical protein
MARGFESKSVADQQEEAQARVHSKRETAEEREPGLAARRRKLELARVDVVQRLERATAPAHREMLQRALKALDEDLKRLG